MAYASPVESDLRMRRESLQPRTQPRGRVAWTAKSRIVLGDLNMQTARVTEHTQADRLRCTYTCDSPADANATLHDGWEVGSDEVADPSTLYVSGCH